MGLREVLRKRCTMKRCGRLEGACATRFHEVLVVAHIIASEKCVSWFSLDAFHLV
jgi:hypothetical protein